MKKTLLAALTALTLGLGFASGADACPHCDHGKGGKQAAAAKAETVALEGKIESYGCEMRAAKMQCTGAALVVGEAKHPIRKARKGVALVRAGKGTDKTFKVTGSKQGEFLTVDSFEIKG